MGTFTRTLTTARTYEADTSGTMTIGDVELAMAGETRGDGSDSYQKVAVTYPDGRSITTETVVYENKKFVATDGGPYVERAPDPDDDTCDGLADFRRQLTNLTDAGVVAVDGRSLHHLVAAQPILMDPCSLGLDGPTYDNVTVSADLYAASDGMPAVVIFTADFTFDSVDGSVEARAVIRFDYRSFDEPGRVASVLPKCELICLGDDDIAAWQLYTSKTGHLSIGYPEAFWYPAAGTKKGEPDLILSTGFDYPARLVIWSCKCYSGGLNDAASSFLGEFKREVKATIDSVESGFIGGTPAQLAAATANDDSSHYYIAMAIKEGRFHYLVLVYPIAFDGGMDVLNDFLTTVTLGVSA